MFTLRLDSDPVLHRENLLVDDLAFFKSDVQNICIDGYHLVKALKAQGISAPQMGVNRRFFFYYDEEDVFQVVINPVITGRSKETSVISETCNSVPEETVLIERHDWIEVWYETLKEGQNVEKRLEGREAYLFQHYMDHLSGILISDHSDYENKTFWKAPNPLR